MPSRIRRPRQAVQRFRDPIQRVMSYFAPVFVQSTGHEPGRPYTLIVNNDKPFEPYGDSGISALIQQVYTVVPVDGDSDRDWKVQTLKYNYELQEADGLVMAYHWHPDGPNPKYKFPHLHLYKNAHVVRTELGQDAHIPTGRVAIEDVLFLAADVFGAQPHEGWEPVLRETRARFEEYRTWGGSGPLQGR